MKQITSGFHLAGRFGYGDCGCFLLENNGEGLIVETPPHSSIKNHPTKIIENYCLKNQIKVKYITCTHHHLDHVQDLRRFRETFPQAKIVLHKSFYADPLFQMFLYFKFGGFIFDELFEGDVFEFILGGEPVFLIHTPKHSLEDIMVVFKGVIITGDWWLGKGDPNKLDIPESLILRSIQRLLDFSQNYWIHSLVSSHANDFRMSADFQGIMKETYEWHEKKLVSKIK